MLENKKIIIFDLDGTLIDSIDIWNKIDIALVKKISGQTIEFSEIKAIRDYIMVHTPDGEDKYLKYFEALAEKYHSSLSSKEISELNDQIAMDMLKTDIDYKSGAAEIIKYFKALDYKLVIATTSPDYMINIYKNENQNIKSKADINVYFDHIYTKESVKNLKPNSEIYFNVLSDYNINPSDCISLEDSLEGVIASKNAGIDVIAMYDKFSDNNREEINEKSTYQFFSFGELLANIKNRRSL